MNSEFGSEVLTSSIRRKLSEFSFGGAPNVDYRTNVAVNELTTFGGLGRVRHLFEPKTVSALTSLISALCDACVPYRVLGRGSNVVISGMDYPLPVIRTTKLTSASFDGNYLISQCGVNCADLVRLAASHGLGGLEFACGIPATFGGLLYMNGGAFGTQIGDYVVDCDVLNGDSVKTVKPTFCYRCQSESGVILSAKLKLPKSELSEINAKISDFRCRRAASQPIGRSCGSVFKRCGDTPAALYIERLNVKGLRIGGAVVSEKHCNFILNTGSATADDFAALVNIIEQRAKDELGVNLEREVEIWTETL